MLLNKIYYLLKPLIPWRLRVFLRRRRANARRVAYASTWPIDEKSGAAPANWPGWPENKRFAFVLTHDVEFGKGLSRVERLMAVEQKYGFRSSFNFVPERDYRLTDSLRKTMEQAGFEVGVHGLKHDGKLYKSKSEFASRAARVRDYLRDWNSCGFRSPLMQHKLDWLHLLGTEYDASTFDTDPFEPEPDGAGTIFPFWVSGPSGSGYVELPYTLAQDFTLFVILNEQDIDIWKKKVDWVAERGGMVLLNTHPDYMCFDGSTKERDEFPVSYYEDFLRYMKEKYDGQYWHALPREVSRYYRSALPVAQRNTRKKICMLAYTGYEADNRVRRYAEALARRGDHVDVIALRSNTGESEKEVICGVTVYRIQWRDMNERQKWTYAWRLLKFLWASSIFMEKHHRQVRYDAIHVHNVPDFLVFAAWYPKWTGAKVILDIHDVVPEFFASKFETGANNHYVQLLKGVEKASAAFSDHVIVSNHLWQEKLIGRSVPREKCSAYVNHVDPAIFYRRPRTRQEDGRFVMMFHGTWQWHQGLDIAIEAMGHLKDRAPHAELHLYGGGGSAGTETQLAELAERLGVKNMVKFCGKVPFDRIAEVIANIDLGVVPKRADSFGDEAYSTKIMEFMSQAIPVVVSRTRIDTYYFDENTVQFFPSGDSKAMADAILAVMENKNLSESLSARGLEYADQHSWDRKKADYLELVDTLTTEPFAGPEFALESVVKE